MLCLLNKSIKYIDPEGPMFTDADTKDKIPNPIPIPFIANFNYRFTGVADTAGSMANLSGPA